MTDGIGGQALGKLTAAFSFICLISPHSNYLGELDALRAKQRHGEVVAQKVEHGVDVVHHEHEGRRQQRQRDGAHAGDGGGVQRGAEREEEDEQLELDEEPLVLELVLRPLGVRDDVRGALQVGGGAV